MLEDAHAKTPINSRNGNSYLGKTMKIDWKALGGRSRRFVAQLMTKYGSLYYLPGYATFVYL